MCQNDQKNDKNIHQMTKNDEKMTILQVAKMSFFLKHCHCLSFCCHFWNIFFIFLHFFEKIAPTWQKNDQKNGSTSRKMQFLQPAKLSLFCHACIFRTMFDIFAYFLRKSRRNDRKMARKDNASRKM